MREIFAVIWYDFCPLSLHCESAQDAIDKAKAMVAKARANGTKLHDVRAVHLPAGSNDLNVLWQEIQNERNLT
jgi:hypothetical protein